MNKYIQQKIKDNRLLISPCTVAFSTRKVILRTSLNFSDLWTILCFPLKYIRFVEKTKNSSIEY